MKRAIIGVLLLTVVSLLTALAIRSRRRGIFIRRNSLSGLSTRIRLKARKKLRVKRYRKAGAISRANYYLKSSTPVNRLHRIRKRTHTSYQVSAQKLKYRLKRKGSGLINRIRRK